MTADAQTVRYAGFWKRANAYGYDVIVVQLVTVALMLAFYTFPSMEQWVRMDGVADHWVGAFTNLCLAISAAYNILLVAGPRQATLGKQYCGIMVVTEHGGRVTLAQSAIRHAASGLSMLVSGLGFLTIPFTAEKTAIHDLIAKTRVVYKEIV
jgi:uncharacterized RDD family membrane protein YckC